MNQKKKDAPFGGVGYFIASTGTLNQKKLGGSWVLITTIISLHLLRGLRGLLSTVIMKVPRRRNHKP